VLRALAAPIPASQSFSFALVFLQLAKGLGISGLDSPAEVYRDILREVFIRCLLVLQPPYRHGACSQRLRLGQGGIFFATLLKT
jgi:hypothetical protein